MIYSKSMENKLKKNKMQYVRAPKMYLKPLATTILRDQDVSHDPMLILFTAIR